MLDTEIDRKLDRRLLTIGGEPCQMQVGKSVSIEPLFDTGDTLIVDVDVADQVRDLGAVRVHPLVLGDEADAGNTQAMDFLLLFGRDLALKPDEASLRGKATAHLGRFEIGQHRTQKLNCLVDVDEPAWLGEERGSTDIRCEKPTIAVEDVRARGCDSILARATPCNIALGHHLKHDEARCDDRIHGSEGRDYQADPRLRRCSPVYVPAIQKRAQHTPPPRLNLSRTWRFGRLGPVDHYQLSGELPAQA
jgi:hypothetical protein